MVQHLKKYTHLLSFWEWDEKIIIRSPPHPPLPPRASSIYTGTTLTSTDMLISLTERKYISVFPKCSTPPLKGTYYAHCPKALVECLSLILALYSPSVQPLSELSTSQIHPYMLELKYGLKQWTTWTTHRNILATTYKHSLQNLELWPYLTSDIIIVHKQQKITKAWYVPFNFFFLTACISFYRCVTLHWILR